MASLCRFRDVECHACGKKGHIAKACRSKKTTPSSTQEKKATLKVQDEASDTPEYTLFNIIDQQSELLRTTLRVDEKDLLMEVDTGSSVSLISETTFQEVWGKDATLLIQPAKVKLCTYTGQEISVVGSTKSA